MKEYSRWAVRGDEVYYPVNSVEDRKKLIEYRKMVATCKNVKFGGRLGTYQIGRAHV